MMSSRRLVSTRTVRSAAGAAASFLFATFFSAAGLAGAGGLAAGFSAAGAALAAGFGAGAAAFGAGAEGLGLASGAAFSSALPCTGEPPLPCNSSNKASNSSSVIRSSPPEVSGAGGRGQGAWYYCVWVEILKTSVPWHRYIQRTLREYF